MHNSPTEGRGIALALFFTLLFALTTLALTACDDAGIPKEVSLERRQATGGNRTLRKEEESLRFGFDLRLNPREDIKIYLPFLRYLSEATGRRFTIVFTDDYETTARYLGTGVTQFAALGPVNCLRANKNFGTICLAVGINAQGKSEYQAAIVARPDSPIQNLSDLRNRSFAFGDHLSTQGYLIPRSMLEENGIGFASLQSYSFAGSHAKVARAVLNGEYAAGAMQDKLARQLAAEGKLKIIAVSRPFPASMICANADVDPRVREQVRQALLAFDPQGKHAAGLSHWEQTEMSAGFAPYDAQAFKYIAVLAERYGLLP